MASKLAKQTTKCANIEVDHVKHFVVSGFTYELNPNDIKKWKFDQWELVGDSIGVLANNFQKAGYNVIINGYMDEAGWHSLQSHITLTHKILLLPHLDVIIHRDSKREGDLAMGSEMVQDHHTEFSENTLYKDFTKLDTTNHSVSHTVDAILDILKSS